MTQGRVAVVGGGVSGLAAAHRLAELGVDLVLLERARRCGGVVQTERVEGFLIEAGPDSFLARKPWAAELCRRMGLGEEIVATLPASPSSFIWSRGRLHPLPQGLTSLVPTRLGALARTRLLSPAGKARLLLEPLVPRRRSREDESLACFFRRRLGREVSERLVEPLVRGIYGGGAETLSLRATFPQLAEIEHRHGSLIRGLLRESRGTASRAAPAFLSLRRGMGSLIEGLTAALPRHTVLTETGVDSLRRLDDGRFELHTAPGEAVLADAALLAVPAGEAARLLHQLDPRLASLLGEIQTVSSLTAALGYERARVRHPLEGHGFVVPRSENSPLLACTWASSKFPGRAPAGYVLLRAFLAEPAALSELEDEDVVNVAVRALEPILALHGPPCMTRIHRWHDALPRYIVGHADRVAEIERRAVCVAGLFLTGASYRGVGIPDCVHHAEIAAEQAAAYLTRRPATLGSAPLENALS